MSEIESELQRLRAERKEKLQAAKASGVIPSTRNAWSTPRSSTRSNRSATNSARDSGGVAMPPQGGPPPTPSPRTTQLSARSQQVNKEQGWKPQLKDNATPAAPTSQPPKQTPRQTPRATPRKEGEEPKESESKQTAQSMLNSLGLLAKIPPVGTKFGHGETGYSIVLPLETQDPSDQEVSDYAKWLGLDPEKEKALLWIARTALTTSLPLNWRACETDAGDVYYFNFGTGESNWEHPLDECFKQLVPVEREALQNATDTCKYEPTSWYIERSVAALMIGYQTNEIKRLGGQVKVGHKDSEEEEMETPQGGQIKKGPGADGEAELFYVPDSGTVFNYESGGYSVVLPSAVEAYDPKDEEVNDYAKWLGIDVANEPELLWIAKEGLKAPLPDEWKPCKTENEEVYYFNFSNGDSMWDHPMDSYYKEMVPKEREKLKNKN